jgi:DNA polymerase
MPVLFRDYETRSTLNLTDAGVHRYAAHPDTDVLACAFAVDDGPVEIWTSGDPTPNVVLEAAGNLNWIVVAFNDQFETTIEREIMAPRYGWPAIPISRHRCLQASALALALPANLDGVAEALGLAHRKDKSGAEIMRKWCRPRKPRRGEDPAKIYWHDDPAEYEQLLEYARQDARIERELHQRIGTITPAEQELWLLNGTINGRGVRADRELLAAAIKIGEAAEHELDAEMAAITGGAVERVTQIPSLKTWLAERGCTVNGMDKVALRHALRRKGISDDCRRAIEIRLKGAHVATGKFIRMREQCGQDGRLRGLFRYHGASTGRFSSFGAQLQNLKKAEDGDVSQAAIDAIMTGDYQHVKSLYAEPLAVVGDITRALLVAARGCRFLIGDFSGIESRVLAWLAGETTKLEAWHRFDQTNYAEDEPYVVLGKRVGLDRAGGKVCDLAFQYQGGVGAWRNFAPDDDTATDDEIKARQQAWRDAHPRTQRFWRTLNSAAVAAVRSPNQTFACNALVSFRCEGDFLKMRLPSGRDLAYPFPTLITDNYGNPAVSFKDNQQGKWVDCRFGHGAYPGTWTENVTSAVARDILAAAMLWLDAAHYPIVMTVHDEIVAECPNGFGSVEEFRHIITTLPPWAEGLPIAAKVRNGPRFAKAEEQGVSQPAPTAENAPAGFLGPSFVRSPAADAQTPGVPWDDVEHIENLYASTATEAPPVSDTGVGAGNGASSTQAEEPRSNGEHNNRQSNGYRTDKPPWGGDLAVYLYFDARGAPRLKIRRTPNKAFPQAFCVDGRWEPKKPAGWANLPYKLPELLAAAPTEPVWIPEGENDVLNLIEGLRLTATCNPGGAGKWGSELAQWFKGKQTAYVLADNDAPGRAHTIKVASALQGIVSDVRIVEFPELPSGGDVSDWLALGHTREELIERAKAAPKFEQPTVALKSARASTFTLRAVEWIWPGRFAVGKLGVIAGLPDEGKGLFLCDVAGRITRPGSAWPCGEGIAPFGNVILLTAEDDIDDTVLPRLKAAGADLEHVEIVQMIPEGEGERMFSLVTDLPLLRQKIVEVGDVRIVQIDPVSAYLGVKKMDSFRNTDVRAVLSPLVSLASELRVLIMGIMHFNKKTDVTNALLRISDSLAFSATPRHVYAVVNDTEHGRKLFVKGKNNLAPADQKALAYSFSTREVGTDAKTGEIIRAPHIVWEQEHVDVTASEAMQAAAESKSPAARDTAKTFLKNVLSAGPVAAAEIEEAAEANGIAKRTLYRAKAELGVQAVKDGPMKDGQRTWRWHPPAKG